MRETEWSVCSDPEVMLQFLHERFSERRFRLFAVACCRSIWNLLVDQRSRKAIDLLERFAEGQASREELLAAQEDAQLAYDQAQAAYLGSRGEAITCNATAAVHFA